LFFGLCFDYSIARPTTSDFTDFSPEPKEAAHSSENSQSETHDNWGAEIVVFGGAVVDLTVLPHDALILGTSNPGKMIQGIGGVGRNIAEALARLHSNDNTEENLFHVNLITVLGKDEYGDMVVSHNEKLKISMKHTLRSDSHSTSIYVATLDKSGDLVVAVADMGLFNMLTPAYISQPEIVSLISRSSMIVIDANWPTETIKFICDVAQREKVPIWYEPTSIPKSTKIIKAGCLHLLTYISPNRGEFVAILKSLFAADGVISGVNITSLDPNDVAAHIQLVKHFQEQTHIPNVIVKIGANGVIVSADGQTTHYKAYPISSLEFVSVTGAGDSLDAGTIFGITKFGHSVHSAVKFGLAAANLSLKSKSAINPDLSASVVQQIVAKNNLGSEVKTEL